MNRPVVISPQLRSLVHKATYGRVYAEFPGLYGTGSTWAERLVNTRRRVAAQWWNNTQWRPCPPWAVRGRPMRPCRGYPLCPNCYARAIERVLYAVDNTSAYPAVVYAAQVVRAGGDIPGDGDVAAVRLLCSTIVRKARGRWLGGAIVPQFRELRGGRIGIVAGVLAVMEPRQVLPSLPGAIWVGVTLEQAAGLLRYPAGLWRRHGDLLALLDIKLPQWRVINGVYGYEERDSRGPAFGSQGVDGEIGHIR